MTVRLLGLTPVVRHHPVQNEALHFSSPASNLEFLEAELFAVCDVHTSIGRLSAADRRRFVASLVFLGCRILRTRMWLSSIEMALKGLPLAL